MRKYYTSNCCLKVPADSASDIAIKNSTFKVHCSSSHGEPAALTNFQSAGFGDAIGLPISMVLQVYLFNPEKKIWIIKLKLLFPLVSYFVLVLEMCSTILSHVICCLFIPFPITRSIEVSSFLKRLFIAVFWKGSSPLTMKSPKIVRPPGKALSTYIHNEI